MVLLISLGIFILVLVGIQIYLRKVWFYRDPKRYVPAIDNIIVSPADGQVIYVKEVKAQNIVCEKLGEQIAVKEISKSSSQIEDGHLIGIYMSPLDVHFNYAPISGVIEDIKHTQAKVNLPMVDLWEYIRITYFRKVIDLFNKKFHFKNERNTLFINGDIPVVMVEIADKFVNKISCFVEQGQKVKIGQKLAFIERGSQVDLFVPKETQVAIEVGQQVFGGLTPIGTYDSPSPQSSPPKGEEALRLSSSARSSAG